MIAETFTIMLGLVVIAAIFALTWLTGQRERRGERRDDQQKTLAEASAALIAGATAVANAKVEVDAANAVLGQANVDVGDLEKRVRALEARERERVRGVAR